MADGEVTMRLDRFLWWARLAKTRSAAQTLATAAHLRIDSRPVSRSSATVRVGNVIVWAAGDLVRIVRVEALPTRRGPAPEAQACYTDLAANVSQQAPPD